MNAKETIFGLVGGLGLFLFGMGLLSEGLKKAAGNRLRRVLHAVTRRRVVAYLVGAGVTCLIQSSSATTVIVVGLVNAGLLTLKQAICVVLGANVGTTFTAWLVAGMSVFKITAYALPAVGLGLIFQVLAGRRWLRRAGMMLLRLGVVFGVLFGVLAALGGRFGGLSAGMELAREIFGAAAVVLVVVSGIFLAARAMGHAARHMGLILIGFGVLFIGIYFMKESFGSLHESRQVQEVLIWAGGHPLLGIAAGAVFTMLIQSSSASIAMIQTMAVAGAFGADWDVVLLVVIPFMLGDDIGTTITAQIAALRTNPSGRRTAMAHTLFNVLAVGLVLPFVYTGLFADFVKRISPAALAQHTIMLHIAVAHSSFKIVYSLLFLPAVSLLERAVIRLVPARPGEGDIRPVTLERHLLDAPPVAADQAKREILRMAATARGAVDDAIAAICHDDRTRLAQVAGKEDAVDTFQTEITRYLVELSERTLSEELAAELPVLLHTVNDIERIGDHAVNLAELATRKLDQQYAFTPMAAEEMNAMRTEVAQMFDDILVAVENFDTAAARRALTHEPVLNRMQIDLRRSHTQRLTDGECSAMVGLLFIDFVDNLEKIGDHLTNVAQGIIGGLRWDGKAPAPAPAPEKPESRGPSADSAARHAAS